MFRRSDTRVVNVGHVAVGGGAPVSVQTMCNIDPLSVDEIISQIGPTVEILEQIRPVYNFKASD